MEGAGIDAEDLANLEFKDDGYIELVLRILGLMCDNQHEGLQVRFYRYTVESRYIEVDGTIFYKFKLPEVQINLHFG